MGLKGRWLGRNTFTSTIVEIRPKWDWKTRMSPFGLNATTELKSDQNGIESCMLLHKESLLRASVEIRPKWDWKRDLSSTESSAKKKVEIRPKWDWKLLKYPIIFSKNSVEIRPKWDWKPINSWKSMNPLSRLKSDQNGIESGSSIELEQSEASGWNQTKMGLKGEITSKSVFKELKGWNQTKMGLKVCRKLHYFK